MEKKCVRTQSSMTREQRISPFFLVLLLLLLLLCFVFSSHLVSSYYARLFLPLVPQIRDHILIAGPPPPSPLRYCCTRLSFYRENNSAFSSFVDWRRIAPMSQYSEWGMRGWSVLGSVPLMGFGVFIGLSSWLADWLGSKLIMHYALFPEIEC